MNVSVVIVHFESPEELDGCLAALGGAPGIAATVVVDNSQTESAQTSADILAQQHGARLLRSADGNIGFAAGCNFAVKDLDDSKFLLFVNPDARVDPSSVRSMVDALTADERLAAVNPIIRTTSGTVWFASGRLQRWLARLVQMPAAHPAEWPVNPTDWVNGCVLLVRTAAFREAGGFDESYFLYWEDVALSVRLHDLGWALGVVNDAEAVHRKQIGPDRSCKVSPVEIEHSVRSRLQFIRRELRWWQKATAYAYTPINLIRLSHRGRTAAGYGPSSAAALRGLRAPT